MIRCAVIDDEPWALALLTDYIGKTDFLELIFSTGNAIEALQKIQQQPVELIFLDIQMPELTGIQFMKINGNRSRVILTTAYSEYALDGYEHNVIDYLLKPISFERFYTAALKAQQALATVTTTAPVATVTPAAAPVDFIFVKTDSRIVNVSLNDILYIEGLKDYIAIHTTKEKLITLESLKTLEEGLPAQKFMRVHKSYIISIEKIDSIERSRIFIKDAVIPIGDTYREAFFKAIAHRNFG
jgi:two-component system, LytTR family, response regulator